MRLSARKLVIASATIVLAGSGLAVIQWMQQPAHGTISQKVPNTEVKGSTNAQEEFTTQHFSTKINASLKVKSKNEVPTAAIIGQYLLTNKDVYESDQLAITVGLVKENSVSEISPVQFRRTQPDVYAEVPSASEFPSGSITFVKNNNYEKSVFWVKDGRYVGVVISGGIQKKADLEEALRVVVANWQWK